MYKLYNGDCLEIMDKLISDNVKVDAIITDIPYGTTNCAWDSIIPFPDMWERINKISKDNSAICLFGSEPFSSALRMSNIKNYKYDWIWEKNRPTGLFSAKKRPMKYHEIISVFYKEQPTYNPIMWQGKESHKRGSTKGKSEHYENTTFNESKEGNLKYPKDILVFDRPHPPVHPTQKPVELMEYLITTYTNENELVLDFTMGSGTTGVACIKSNRNFIGIELDKNYFNIAKKRIEDENAQGKLF